VNTPVYIFHIDSLPDLLAKASTAYNVLEVNNKRVSQYESLYFDTSGFKIYTMHHNGKANRYKFRYRRYIDSGLCYFEIKFKSNKDRTVKSRTKCDGIKNVLNDKAAKVVNEKLLITMNDFYPVIWIYYSRITLVNKISKERVTIDTGLKFKNDKKEVSFPSLVIAEVKQEKNSNSFITKLMKEKHIQQVKISKYCLGIIKLYETVKKNRFKIKLLKLNKICYE
jgi:hypothetical protein